MQSPSLNFINILIHLHLALNAFLDHKDTDGYRCHTNFLPNVRCCSSYLRPACASLVSQASRIFLYFQWNMAGL